MERDHLGTGCADVVPASGVAPELPTSTTRSPEGVWSGAAELATEHDALDVAGPLEDVEDLDVSVPFLHERLL
jgi:hypothetical protein